MPTQSAAPPPDIARYVTGAAAAALDANGFFSAAKPLPRERVIISRDEAALQALAYVKSYAQFLRGSWEDERGAPIRTGSLRASPRVYYAESPYGPLPEGPFHPAFRKSFGPYYVVTLQDGADPVLVVAVSAFNTDVRVDERGDVHQPWLGGGEFLSAAVPRGSGSYRPLGPEQAVERVARVTGARANSPPELVLRARWHPSLALWKVPLDRGVQVRATGRRGLAPVIVDALYVNGTGRTYVPSPDQPAEIVKNLIIGPPWGERVSRTMPVRIPVMAGQFTAFEEVVVESH